MKDKNFERAKSVTPMSKPNAIELIKTIQVESINSFLVSQETFFNSTMTSMTKFRILLTILKSTGQEGVEPSAFGFGDRRSTNWSYWPMIDSCVLFRDNYFFVSL